MAFFAKVVSAARSLAETESPSCSHCLLTRWKVCLQISWCRSTTQAFWPSALRSLATPYFSQKIAPSSLAMAPSRSDINARGGDQRRNHNCKMADRTVAVSRSLRRSTIVQRVHSSIICKNALSSTNNKSTCTASLNSELVCVVVTVFGPRLCHIRHIRQVSTISPTRFNTGCATPAACKIFTIRSLAA